jgi:hypothetical protein
MHALKNTSRGILLAIGLSLTGFGLLSGDGAGPSSAVAAEQEKHPHIRAAIREMKEARKELKDAAHDFGGHRVKAIEDLDRGIEQLEKCLKFDK